MFTRLSPNIQAILFAVLGYASFSVSDTMVKLLTGSYNSFQIIGFRAFIITTLFVIIAPKLGGFKRTFKTKKLKVHIARGLSNTTLLLLITAGLAKLDLPEFYTIIFFTPFITTILARIFFKEHINAHGMFAIILGFLGVLTVVRPGVGVFNPWLLLPFAATFFIAALCLLVKPLDKDETMLSFALYPTLSNIVLVSLPMLVLYDIPTITDWPYFLISAITATTGLIFSAIAYRKAKACIVAPIQYSQILWGIAFGALIFHQTPDVWTLAGASIIIGAGLYLLYSEKGR